MAFDLALKTPVHGGSPLARFDSYKVVSQVVIAKLAKSITPKTVGSMALMTSYD